MPKASDLKPLEENSPLRLMLILAVKSLRDIAEFKTSSEAIIAKEALLQLNYFLEMIKPNGENING